MTCVYEAHARAMYHDLNGASPSIRARHDMYDTPSSLGGESRSGRQPHTWPMSHWRVQIHSSLRDVSVVQRTAMFYSSSLSSSSCRLSIPLLCQF